MENFLLFSSSSKSMTVVPSSTLPILSVAPQLNSIASQRVVLPSPLWPITAMSRISFAVILILSVPLSRFCNGCLINNKMKSGKFQ